METRNLPDFVEHEFFVATRGNPELAVTNVSDHGFGVAYCGDLQFAVGNCGDLHLGVTSFVGD